MSLEEATLYVVALGLCSLSQLLFVSLYNFKMLKIVMQMKAAVSGLIFRKVRLKTSCVKTRHVGTNPIFHNQAEIRKLHSIH